MKLPTALSPYAVGIQADSQGEVEIYCPLHSDSRRSASVNLRKRMWHCFAGCGGGPIHTLLEIQDIWVPMEGRNLNESSSRPRRKRKSQSQSKITLEVISRWHERLMKDEDLIEELYDRKGILPHTVCRFLLGHDGDYYRIPIFSPSGQVWNVRTYDMNAAGTDRRKIWSIPGMGQPRLYPIGVLDDLGYGDRVIICEGEWDAILTNQEGCPAITRTGAADVWRPYWSRRFRGLHVHLCHDADTKGQQANETIAQVLKGYALSVSVAGLPYEVQESNGLDLSDYILEGGDIERLLYSENENGHVSQRQV